MTIYSQTKYYLMNIILGVRIVVLANVQATHELLIQAIQYTYIHTLAINSFKSWDQLIQSLFWFHLSQKDHLKHNLKRYQMIKEW